MNRLELRTLLDDLKKKLTDVRNDPDLDDEMKKLSDEEWMWLTLMYELRTIRRGLRAVFAKQKREPTTR